MIQNGMREKKRFFYSFHKDRESIRKKDFESTEKSKIISETIYGYDYVGNITWKHYY